MPRIHFSKALVVLILAGGLHTSRGDVIISVDVDPNAPGIQSQITKTPGVKVIASIVVAADAAEISYYGISAQFDTVDLDLVSAAELLPALFTFNITTGVSVTRENIGGSFGQVRTFEAATFGIGPVSSTFTAGTITFDVPAPAGGLDIDIMPEFFNTGIDSIFDNAGSTSTVSFVGAAVLITEPSALGLLFLMGIMSLRRRTK